MREPDGSGRYYGAVPPRGSQIRMSRYRSGGGAHGNVDRSKLTVLKSTVPYIDRVSNRVRAMGGRDAESLEHAKLRAPRSLRTRDRAVTAEDFEVLALEASPGVARARCLQPRAIGAVGPAVGTVQLLLVPEIAPREGRILPEQLVLSQETQQEVEQYLDERRMLATALILGQPQYLFVRVEARIKARREADPDAIQREVVAHLYRFLNPLAGGTERNGWPFGRDLYISEVYAILQGIADVEYIEQVNLLLEGSKEAQVRIAVPPNALIASAEHLLVVV
jgi:predicted phage baseplate assembly protein